MKHKFSSLLMMALSMTLLFACNKKNNNNNTPATACSGGNICFKLDGTLETHTAKWMVLSNPSRYRILWEDNGSPAKNIEMDIYGTTAGTYTVANNPSSGQGGFQYFIAGSKNIQGKSGTITLSSTASDQFSGTFTITGEQNGVTYQITEGHFENVPK
jgi:hypothetical protein